MFTVVWSSAALDALADVYVVLDLAGQDRVAAAVDALNRRLADDPHDEGESRSGGFRITFIDRLAVSFLVTDARHLVQVTAVSPYGR
jgi:plasmid stabilization system protein ParE